MKLILSFVLLLLVVAVCDYSSRQSTDRDKVEPTTVDHESDFEQAPEQISTESENTDEFSVEKADSLHVDESTDVNPDSTEKSNSFYFWMFEVGYEMERGEKGREYADKWLEKEIGKEAAEKWLKYRHSPSYEFGHWGESNEL